MISLDKLKINERALVKKLNNNNDIKRRLLDIGVIPGSEIECIMESPFNDPKAYLVKGAVYAIRNSDTKNILVDLIV